MFRFILNSILSCGIAFAQLSDGRISNEELIRRLRRSPSDMALIGEVASRGGPEAVAGLKDAFAAVQRSGNARTETLLRPSQMIAFELSALGEHDQVYFDELAKYARAAIDANPPDARGTEENAYRQWCEQRSLVGEDCSRAVTRYAMDLNALGASMDKRATPIFRRALDLANPVLVSTAAGRLARLQDAASLPLIAHACTRFREKDSNDIGSVASYFDSPEMRLVLDQCVTDASLKEQLAKSWEERHRSKQ